MAKSTFTEAYGVLLHALVAARKDAGVTQVELAERLAKPQSFVSKIETGERRLDVVEFCAVAIALEIDGPEFLKFVLSRLPAKIDI